MINMRTSISRVPRGSIREVGYAPPITAESSRRRFVAYFFFVGWDCLSFGVHVALLCPNIEIHLPFGFIRIGWQMR